ncbi:Hypp2949 [Branchiostoma lanceolatum]|uniref:Hypp2949 protein n=1 Tax=Branchiostoma lanceolatum TaxID=7740 RepID=A0A8J9ZYM7_BRALA|nr:Hypp2949 [Branchiostoma lanceolatum]
MANRPTGTDAHAELLMEGSGLKTYRQKMQAQKQQHDWEMKLLEKERRWAWNFDRVEQNRLLSRLESINKRIQEINKRNSKGQNLQTKRMPLLNHNKRMQFLQGNITHNRYNMSLQKLDKNEKNTFISRGPFLWGDMRQPDVFQDSRGVVKNQGTLGVDTKSREPTVTGSHLPSVSQNIRSKDHRVSSNCSLDNSQLANSNKLPSIKKSNHKGSSEDAKEEVKNSVKPRLVRRRSMDPKLLASLLNVDESSVEKQNQVFQRARLNSDAALRGNSEDPQEKSEETGKEKKLQRRTSIASMHMPSDLLKIGFPELGSGAQLSPGPAGTNDKDFPASTSFFPRARRNSLPFVSTMTDGKFTKLGSRKMSIGTTKSRTSSLDKLENVIEESEEHSRHSEREETMKNLMQNVMSMESSLPLSLRKKEQ